MLNLTLIVCLNTENSISGKTFHNNMTKTQWNNKPFKTRDITWPEIHFCFRTQALKANVFPSTKQSCQAISIAVDFTHRDVCLINQFSQVSWIFAGWLVQFVIVLLYWQYHKVVFTLTILIQICMAVLENMYGFSSLTFVPFWKGSQSFVRASSKTGYF